MAPRNTDNTPLASMATLKALLGRAEDTVEIPVADLLEVDDNIEHAVLYLAAFISRKMKEQGFEDLDHANEGSRDLSELIFLETLIGDAGLVTERHLNKALERR